MTEKEFKEREEIIIKEYDDVSTQFTDEIYSSAHSERFLEILNQSIKICNKVIENNNDLRSDDEAIRYHTLRVVTDKLIDDLLYDRSVCRDNFFEELNF